MPMRHRDDADAPQPWDLPPSIQEMLGPEKTPYLLAGLMAPADRYAKRPDGGATAAVLIEIAAALTKSLAEFAKAVDAVGQIATLIAKMMSEIAWLIRRIVSDEFVQSRIRAADIALGAIQDQLQIAAIAPPKAVRPLLEKLYEDVQAFGVARRMYEDLNRDREGLGLPGYLTTASLHLKVTHQLLIEKSPLVDAGSLEALRSIHIANAEGAFRRAFDAIPSTFQVVGHWAHQGYYKPPAGKEEAHSIENVDWNAAHPRRYISYQIGWVDDLHLGVVVKDPNAQSGWTWVEPKQISQVLPEPVSPPFVVYGPPPLANSFRDAAAPQLRAMEAAKEEEARNNLIMLIRQPMETVIASWRALVPPK